MTSSTPQMEDNNAAPGFLGLRRCIRCGFWLSLSLLVLVTVVLTSSRLLMPLIAGKKDTIEAQLTDILGTEVSIGRLQGRWYRLSPTLTLENLDIQFASSTDPSQQLSHIVQHLSIKLDVLSSLLQRELVIEQISIDELQFEFVEDQQGRWSVAGFDGDTDYTEQMINLVLNISNLQLSETTLILRRASGSVITLNNAFLGLQNFEQQHDLQLQVRLENQASPIRFSMEISGDPRAEFSASAFLVMNNIDLTNLLMADISEDYIISTLTSSAQVWIDYSQDKKWEVHAEVEDVTFEAEAINSALAVELSSGSAEVTALQSVGQQWQVWLQQPQFDFYRRPWESDDFFLDIDLSDEEPRLELAAKRIDLGMLNDMLEMLTLPEAGQQVLEQLHPSGALTNIKFSSDFSNGFDLAANLENVGTGAWTQVPAIEGINGYLQANQVSGFVELDSQDLDIHLPRVFNDGWHYDDINSRVHWYITDEVLRVNSSVIDVQNEGIHGRVQFDLNNVRNEVGGWNAELTILVGALEFDASQKTLYLPTLDNIKDTMSWLDGALIGGDVSNSGFVFRGRVAGNAPGSNTIQTFYNVENAVLEFLPDWPRLENIEAFVKVRNNDVDVSAQSALMSGIELGPTLAMVRLNEEAEGAWLTVNGSSLTSTAQGLDFIRNSPVQDYVGAYVNNWRAEGQVDVDIALGIPLNNASLENIINVSVLSDNSTLELPDYALTFEEISGEVTYSSVTGLRAEALSGSLFDFPLASRIETFSETAPGTTQLQSGTRFISNGRASEEALQNWTGQSDFIKDVLDFTNGEIDYLSEFELFNNDNGNEGGVLSRLSLSSDLPGLEISLPAPFYKALDDIRQLAVEIEFLQDSEIFNILYDDNFSAQVVFQNDELAGGQLFFGALNQDFAIRQVGSNRNALVVEPGLLLNGNMDYFNYEEWDEVAQNFIGDPQGSAQSEQSLEDYVRQVNIDIGSLNVFGMELFQVNTQVSRSELAWNVALENEMLAGSFAFPDDDLLPFEINLDYLRFPEAEEEEVPEGMTQEEYEAMLAQAEPEEEIDLLGDVDPSGLPNINFQTAELSIGERNLGAWEFGLRTNGGGATISNLKMTAEQARITDLSMESGANLDWRYSNGVHTSSFNGLLQADDLAQVLPSWGLDANVQSESAEFISNLQWPGSPAAFSIMNSSGQVEIDIATGRFVDIDSDSARLFAAFNFDAIVRRLQLDFSDLYEKGLAYDKISGKLNFDTGKVNTDGQVLIQGPSSTINLDGEIDLVNETIDADMLVSISFSENIAVIAGILSAWPIAVGTYLAGKIFKDQLDDFTTVRYRLEGPWAELDAGFEPDNREAEEEIE